VDIKMALKLVKGCIIPAGESLSNGVDCTGSTRTVRILIPPEWTLAPLTFQLSPFGTTYNDLYHVVTPGVAYSAYEAVVADPPPGCTLTLPAGLGEGVSWVKVRSGTSGIPVPQPTACEFAFVLEVPDTVAAAA
jgi:hypothetical protein